MEKVRPMLEKTFLMKNNKVISFKVPLGRRKRRYCPTCKRTFPLCPFEQNQRIVHHYLCSTRCKPTLDGRCPYTIKGTKPPTCGTLIGRKRTCKSCLHYRKSGKCTIKEALAIRRDGLTQPTPITPNNTTYVEPNTEACIHYVNRTHKNK